MVLQIKLETSISTSEDLETENTKLKEKVDSLSSNISNAETRSEKATVEVAEAIKGIGFWTMFLETNCSILKIS